MNIKVETHGRKGSGRLTVDLTVDGKSVGFVTLEKKAEDRYEIEMLKIPDPQDRNKGYSKYLLKELDRLIKEWNVEIVGHNSIFELNFLEDPVNTDFKVGMYRRRGWDEDTRGRIRKGPNQLRNK
jgi:hypothetical protein